LNYQLKRIVTKKLPYQIPNRDCGSIIISIVFVFLIHFSTFCQTKKDKVPLIEVLSQLEKTSNYKFTYANSVINSIKTTHPPKAYTFKEKIRFLTKNTGLDFQFINDNFIAIKVSRKIISVCGYILDAETGMPLEAVAIIGNKQQLITDNVGYFKIDAGIAESIEIRYLGFKPISLKATTFDVSSCKNIYLEPDIESLSEIVLENLFAKGINKTSNGILNVNFSNFGILPGLIETDVFQTIQALPGIQSVNETVSDINIRGGTNAENLILWDGIKMYQSGHFFGLISALSPQITNNASIIKNGSSVEYTDGVSGTVAMSTDKKINDVFKGSIATNFINADVFTDIPTSKNSSLQLSARKAINNLTDVNTPTYAKYFDRIQQDTEIQDFENDNNTTFDFYDTSLRWLYDISDKDFVRINFLYINNDLSFLESARINGEIQSKNSRLEQNTLASSIYFKRDWSNYFTTTIQISNSEYKLGANNVNVLQANSLTQVNKVEETSTKLNTWYIISDEISLLSGYQFTETAVNNLTNVDNPEFIRLVREVVREHGLYSQLNYKNEKAYVSIGARYNYISKFKKHIIEPRLNINYKLTDKLSFELLGEFKHQNTMQIINFQNDFFGIEKRRWFLSNDSTRPVIQSKQMSFGVNYTNNGWLMSLDGYFKNVDNITAQSQGFLNQYIFSQALGSYDTYGIEFLLNKKIGDFSTWLSYTYANNEYTFNNLPEVNFPNNLDIRQSGTFGASYALNNLKFSAGINWHTGIPFTRPITNNEFSNERINYEAANSDNLNDYFRIDASVTYKFKMTKKIKAQTGISVWNASNNDNIISQYYISNESNQVNKVVKNALKLTPNFSFRVLF